MSESHSDAKKKPVNYEDLFPGRFLKGSLFVDETSIMFLGKNPTFTIKDFDMEELPQDKGGTKACPIISFFEVALQWKLNSTNGQCCKAMFGKKLAAWRGKKVTFCAEKDRDPKGGGQVDTVRVYGSPDIERDLTIEIELPQRRPKPRTLHRTVQQQPRKPAAQQPTGTSQQKPPGDVEDAIVRLTNAPPDEIDAVADELRRLYQWGAQDGKRLKETLERLQPKPKSADPEDFDR